jgi:hypothetical protein
MLFISRFTVLPPLSKKPTNTPVENNAQAGDFFGGINVAEWENIISATTSAQKSLAIQPRGCQQGKTLILYSKKPHEMPK